MCKRKGDMGEAEKILKKLLRKVDMRIKIKIC